MILKQEESLNQVSRMSLREGELQSDSRVLWNVLEDLHLLILNHVLFFFFFFPCNRSLVLWHNGVKLSRASWELTFTLPLTLTVLRFCKALQFLRAVFKCQPGGYCQEYKLLSICHDQLTGAALIVKVILYFLKLSKWSHLSGFFFFFLSCHYTGLASYMFYLLSACEICKIETVQYVYFVNLPFL